MGAIFPASDVVSYSLGIRFTRCVGDEESLLHVLACFAQKQNRSSSMSLKAQHGD